MKKINIAELLKDCPTGMELDCSMYDNVTLISVNNGKDTVFPIKVSRSDGHIITLTKYGQYTAAEFAKCVIFPKGKTTWEGFQRPFKDGDVVVTDLGSVFFLNTRLNSDETYGCYVGIGGDGSFHVCVPFAYKECCGLATEEEKQKLFKAIKDNGYKWNAETKTLEKLIEPKFKVGDRIKSKNIHTNYLYDNHIFTITEISSGRYWSNRLAIEYIENQDDWELVPNKFNITTLKPFDKVLVRVTNKYCWHATFYSYYRHSFYTTNGIYAQCIPYEGNEHLLGTTNDCDEYFKTWE